ALDRLADLVIADRRARRRRLAGGVRFDLLAAPAFVLAGSGRVVAVAIDDHRGSLPAALVVGRGKHLPRQAVNAAINLLAGAAMFRPMDARGRSAFCLLAERQARGYSRGALRRDD